MSLSLSSAMKLSLSPRGRSPYGPQLFDEFNTLGAGCTDNGDGTYSVDGTQPGNTSLIQNYAYVNGTTYKVDFELANVTGGEINPHINGVASGNVSASGEYSVEITAGSSGGLNFFASAIFVGDIIVVSVREVL